MKTFLRSLGIICLLIGLEALKEVALLANMVWQSWGLSINLAFNTAWFFLIIGVIALSIYLAKRYAIWDFSSKCLTWKNLGWALLIFVTMRLVAVLGSMVSFIEQGGLTQTANDGQVIEMTASQPLVISFLILVLLAPIVEEIVFRGLLMSVLCKNQAILGIVLSSLTFGLIHGPTNLGAWLIYGGMGLVLALAYHKSKSLSLVIAGHMINNLLAFLAINFLL